MILYYNIYLQIARALLKSKIDNSIMNYNIYFKEVTI